VVVFSRGASDCTCCSFDYVAVGFFLGIVVCVLYLMCVDTGAGFA